MQQKSSKEMTGTVRDQQGRQRFHGAFTGGFSAGYFNTVGSAEGFQPVQFVSSRSNRAAPLQRTAKDFMDEEDGLLGGSLLTKQELDSFKDDGAVKGVKLDALSAADRVIMDHFILQPSNTIGKKLLTLLGWKPGIAIGPRKKKTVDLGYNLPSMAMDEGFVTFAPRIEYQSSSSIRQLPRSKADTKGLGYEESVGDVGFLRRDNVKSQDANRYHMKNLFQQKQPSSSNIKSTTAYLDEDDDIAFDDSVHDISQYNAVEIDEQTENNTTNTQLSTTKSIPTSYERCPSDNRLPLTGFHVASRGAKVVIGIAYPPPTVPKDFSAYHTFTTLSQTISIKTGQQSVNNRKSRFAAMDVLAQRQEGLSDEKKDNSSSSVFGLLKSEDRLRIQALAASMNPNLAAQSTPVNVSPPTQTAAVKERPLLVSSTLLQSKFAALSQSFKSRFTSASSSSSAAAGLDNDSQGGITSAESLKEMINNKAAAAAALASFENGGKEALPKKSVVRRTTVVWSPSSLLCKRCNVKAPDHASVYRPPGSAQAVAPANNKDGGDDLMQQMFQAPPQSSSSTATVTASVAASTAVSAELQRQFEAQDVYQAAAQPPPIDVFKSIFADSDSDDEEDEGDAEAVDDTDSQPTAIAAPAATKGPMLPPPPRHPSTANFKPPLNINVAPKKEEAIAVAEPNPSNLPTFIPKSKRSTTTSTSSLLKPTNSSHKPGVIAAAILTAEDDEEDLPDPSPTIEVKGQQQVKQNKRLITTTNDDDKDDDEEEEERQRSLKRKKMSGRKETGSKKVKLSFGGDDENNE